MYIHINIFIFIYIYIYKYLFNKIERGYFLTYLWNLEDVREDFGKDADPSG